MKKYVFAGASGRALGMYCIPMLKNFADCVEICGVYDINPGRSRAFVAKAEAEFPVFEDFDEMLNTTKPDVVIVTTVDAYHAEYIIRSLNFGCDVITEKPMTTNDDLCRQILAAEKASGHKVIVTFNYRYAPFNTRIKELINEGVVGEVFSVHFEWLLTRNMELGAHGTSYFRRWNARMNKSSGLLVHKSTHHFDLINWWLGQHPSKVSAFAQLNLYGSKNSPFADVPAPGLRCANCPHAEECEFYYELSDFEKFYYADNEAYDGYMKDNCIYAEDIDIYDTMAVTVQYDKGAVLSYSLNATTPYEGWHAVINGSKGRLEIHNYEAGLEVSDQNHILFYDLNNNVTDYAITKSKGGHGGGDTRLRKMLFLDNIPDPLGHAAGTTDGAYSILIGVGANKSIKESKVVDIEELLK